ncbi:MAG: flagellar basal body rod protein FlgB [Bradyrhizobium sp.]|nr:MAG: flagellar basal body rod protein FlgB [Bradyrhizobium sp.]
MDGIARVSQPYVLQLAAQRTHWLSARDQLIATNVANANTPNFKATDLQPFSAILNSSEISMISTNPAHLTPGADDLSDARAVENDSSESTLSGNTVHVEDEMMKLSEVNRDYALTTNIKRVIHQMMMAVLK